METLKRLMRTSLFWFWFAMILTAALFLGIDTNHGLRWAGFFMGLVISILAPLINKMAKDAEVNKAITDDAYTKIRELERNNTLLEMDLRNIVGVDSTMAVEMASESPGAYGELTKLLQSFGADANKLCDPIRREVGRIEERIEERSLTCESARVERSELLLRRDQLKTALWTFVPIGKPGVPEPGSE